VRFGLKLLTLRRQLDADLARSALSVHLADMVADLDRDGARRRAQDSLVLIRNSLVTGPAAPPPEDNSDLAMVARYYLMFYPELMRQYGLEIPDG
jgi:hypothetical protein